MKYRIEKDSIGEVQIPAEVYYGINTFRAKNNFDITKRGISRQLIKALAIVKKAAAKANADAEAISLDVSKAIMAVCDEILNGKWHGQFITDLIQGGAGTSINMNANEVIANRANEMLGGKKGTYEFVHPLDHVNRSQSTNDVIPTAGKIALIKQIKKLIVELKKLQGSLQAKANEYQDVVKMGRTHLQEAVPITVGQEFNAYAAVLGRDLKRLDSVISSLSEVNMGATAIGTGLNANPKYIKKVVSYLNKFSGEELHQAKDLIDSTRNLDCFVWASSAIKTLAVNLSKMANDIRLLASSGSTGIREINLPIVQQGSSIIPGKYNPVVPEVVNQVAFYVMGLDVTIAKAVEAGQLELNVFEPVILMALFEELTNLRHAIRTFNELAITSLTINKDVCATEVANSNSIVTALSPHIGYDLACALIDEANREKRSVRDLIIERKILSAEEAEIVLNPEAMTLPGINGEELIKKETK